MKFAKFLYTESVPEWKYHYIDYKELKRLLRLVENSYIHAREQKEASAHRVRNTASYSSTSSDNSSLQAPKKPYIHEDTPGRLSEHSATGITNLLKRISTNFMAFSRRTSLATNAFSPVTEEDHLFFQTLRRELDKVSEFYEGKERAVAADLRTLKGQLKMVKKVQRERLRQETAHLARMNQGDNLNSGPVNDRENPPPEIDHKETKSKIQKAVFEFYRGLDMLKSYRVMNKLGFAKIIKKYEKVTGKSSAIPITYVNSFNFVNSKVLARLIKDTENFYVKNFENGMRKQAMMKLRIPARRDQTFHFPMLRFGFYMGLSLCLVARGFQEVETTVPLANISPDDFLMFRTLYGSFLIPIVFALLFGVNMIIWTKARINYKFVFDHDPRDNLDYREYLELAAFALLILCVAFFFNVNLAPSYVQKWCPPLFVLSFLAFIFCPFPIFYQEARRWLILTTGRVMASPFSPVEFGSFFLADALNSMGYSLVGLGVFACAYREERDYGCLHRDRTSILRPIVLYSLGPIWRVLQLLRRYKDSAYEPIHLINIGKYASSILAISLLFLSDHGQGLSGFGESQNKFKIMWISSQVVSSLYSFAWDIYMDWSLFDPESDNFLLRDSLGFKHKSVYYYAIVSNLFLRFSWCTYLLLPDYIDQVSFYTALGEMFRRCQWAVFRIENEHINNYEFRRAFRAVPEIKHLPVKPNSLKSDVGPSNRPSRAGSRVLQIARSWVPKSTPESRDFAPRIDQSTTQMLFSTEDDEVEDGDSDFEEDEEDYDHEVDELASHRTSLSIPYSDDLERQMRERENSLRMLESGVALKHQPSAFLQGKPMQLRTFDGYNSRRLLVPGERNNQRRRVSSISYRDSTLSRGGATSETVEEEDLETGDVILADQSKDVDSTPKVSSDEVEKVDAGNDFATDQHNDLDGTPKVPGDTVEGPGDTAEGPGDTAEGPGDTAETLDAGDV